MRFVTAAEMRELDRRAESEFHIPTHTLMLRAGRAVADTVVRLRTLFSTPPSIPVLLYAGRGNNGGDAFAAASLLRAWGIPCILRSSATSPSDMRTSAARAFYEEAGGPTPSFSPLRLPPNTLVVDGLLGTGITSNPHGVEASLIEEIQCLRSDRHAFVLSIDLPSGMNADTDTFGDPSVTADLTLTLALPKLGMSSDSPTIAERCGRIKVADIGFPPELIGPEEENGLSLIDGPSVSAPLPPRPRAAHKGDFGHAVLVGGSARYTGAIGLAAEAAARCGAGLVSVLTTPQAAAPLRVRTPEAMVSETLSPEILRKADPLLVGPGLGLDDEAIRRLESALHSRPQKLVLDADALTLLSAHPDLLNLLPAETVLTPHPGEAARLLHTSVAAVQSNRREALRSLVEATHCVVLLKGSGTLISAPHRGCHILRGGNPGMATGGSGDALAGLVAGFLAQGLSAFGAARAAAWLHAKQGDEFAWCHGEPSLLARDLIPTP